MIAEPMSKLTTSTTFTNRDFIRFLLINIVNMVKAFLRFIIFSS